MSQKDSLHGDNPSQNQHQTTNVNQDVMVDRSDDVTPGANLSDGQEAPRPAVRRKLQQIRQQVQEQESAPSATFPRRLGSSSEKMQAINDATQEVDRDHSSQEVRVKNNEELRERPLSNYGAIPQSVTKNTTNLSLVSLKTTQVHEQPDTHSILQPLDEDQPARPYPKKVLFIVINELCERFSYYGLRTVLVLYFRTVLGLTDASSTVSYHLFATICYLTPILGGILADSILGKYRTILYLSAVYFLGELILVFSSVFWDLNGASLLFTWIGLVFIGVGTGGIKPCVAAFAGDQFLESENSRRESFFSLFYATINIGSLISMFATPLLRSNYSCVGRTDCYPLAFGVPCALIFIATVVFSMAHNHYYIAPLPPRNPIVAFCQCTWLAVKRKLAGRKLKVTTTAAAAKLAGQVNYGLSEEIPQTNASPSPSTSSISLSSSENEAKSVAPVTDRDHGRHGRQLVAAAENSHQVVVSDKRHHWLYLAADRFDNNSIEEFRSALGLLLLFSPTPVYWCLYDQQGSLWTLQATRMDGRVFGSDFVLEPDQIMVANPIILLALIPVFQFIFYPMFSRCNIITTSIQRMVTGGMIAALAFVASSIIELQLQQNLPLEMPAPGQLDLLLVNGLSGCSVVEPTISFVGPQNNEFSNITALATLEQPYTSTTFDNSTLSPIPSLAPLASHRLTPLASYLNNTNLKLTFSLSEKPTTNTTAFNQGCPFDAKQMNELYVGSLAERTTKLLYIEQGNGKLGYRLFDDSLALPSPGKARVRLLYEFFGSSVDAVKRKFYLKPIKSPKGQEHYNEVAFNMSFREGQILLSDYLEIEVGPAGDLVTVFTNVSALNIHHLGNQNPIASQPNLTLTLKPGTRNLLILHQLDAKNAQLNHELLQDNDYRISVLYQLIPYTMISMSEVMYSITALEFGYSMAPPSLRSLMMGSISLTVALGNILTVLVESFHPFANIAHDFLFYASIMALDMLVFAFLGYNYEPYQPYVSRSHSRSNK